MAVIFRFRAARLTQSGARQPLPAAEEANEEETEEEVSVDSSESDTDELAETEYVAEGPTEAGYVKYKLKFFLALLLSAVA